MKISHLCNPIGNAVQLQSLYQDKDLKKKKKKTFDKIILGNK